MGDPNKIPILDQIKAANKQLSDTSNYHISFINEVVKIVIQDMRISLSHDMTKLLLNSLPKGINIICTRFNTVEPLLSDSKKIDIDLVRVIYTATVIASEVDEKTADELLLHLPSANGINTNNVEDILIILAGKTIAKKAEKPVGLFARLFTTPPKETVQKMDKQEQASPHPASKTPSGSQTPRQG
ncbi:MAG: hypothetical protein KDH94_08500 [Coxiellaceae bacterium]|nr:hypothetical protein [Coxiellaceae bacterium]